MTRAELAELAGALAAFQAEVPVIPKKQTAQIKTDKGANYSYTYADLATISPVVLPLLAKHGLAFTALPTPAKGDRGPVLRGMLVHTSGQYLRGELPITGRTPQEIGSSLTYGRRYLLGCLTGVVTDDDDDGQLAERAGHTRARKDRPPGVPDPPPPVAPVTPIQRKPRKKTAPVAAGQPPHGMSEPDPPGPDPHDNPSDGPTDAQRRALFAAIGASFPDSQRTERLALCSAVLGRPVRTSNELSAPDVSAMLAWVDDYRAGRETYQYDPETELAYVWPTDPPPEDVTP